jgi:hypothetical protein
MMRAQHRTVMQRLLLARCRQSARSSLTLEAEA